jgi:hypothetical protein
MSLRAAVLRVVILLQGTSGLTRLAGSPDHQDTVTEVRNLWIAIGSVRVNCCWPSPAQSFLGPGAAELMTIICNMLFRNVASSSFYNTGGWTVQTPSNSEGDRFLQGTRTDISCVGSLTV